MNFVTSIGVNDSVQSIDNLIQQLRGGNVDVNAPLPDTDLLAADVPAAEYQVKLMLFQSIASASFHIIDNPDGVITPDLALQVLYAMSKQRPVVFAVAPHFSSEVAYSTRSLIQQHLEQFVVLDINHATSDEISTLATELPEQVDYQLEPEQLQAIRYQSKAYFRDLLSK